MRGAIVALLLFMWMPFILFKPYIGVLLWDWISHMNPHKQSYGFATTFPFLDFVAAMTLGGLVLSKDNKSLPGHPIIAAMLIYLFWTLCTTMMAFEPNHSYGKLIYIFKVMLFAMVAVMVMKSPIRLKAFIYVMMASLAFIGIKGGLFTIMTGGSGRVQGAGGMMEDNNQLAMAMAMLVPLSIFFVQHPPHRLLKWPAIGSTVAIILSVIGTQSRGGFAALAGVLGMILMKSKYRFKMLVLMIPLVVAGYYFVPDSWKARMESTGEATEDTSFLGRVIMWRFSSNVADDNPMEGGGFNIFYLRRAQELYMPPGRTPRAPHSSYFEVLAEHGYVGLVLYLTMLFTAWYAAGTNAKRFRPYEQTRWIGDLCAAIQLGLVGYALGGLTVNIATFDLFYHFMAVIVMCSVVGEKMLTKDLTTQVGGVSVKVSTKWAPPGHAAKREGNTGTSPGS
ncbi:putative O-glycosylation ligase, exosortase A system-associated [Kordiimonas gwangyangensis]|uniref:putative O-glycosylation ligase, exosortase A system-associated n=1 Tax=Kordiimonas gwangyangensis TaxID=288022 RepID=UPI000374A813|nr:putative O-glycosylation ligase, exosortase A system-associated [Kordiimonas gwangyangensis]